MEASISRSVALPALVRKIRLSPASIRWGMEGSGFPQHSPRRESSVRRGSRSARRQQPNITFDRTAGARPLAAARQRERWAAATAGAILVLVVLFAPLVTSAQPAGKVPRIGVLWGYSPSDVSRFGEAFRQGLASVGYVEWQNIALQERWSEGNVDRLPSLAAELVRLNSDVIVAASTAAARATQQATKTIPIVLTLVTDPVGDGFATSLARPGGNVTGLSMMHPELSGKRLALLKDIVPKASRVAVLRSPSTPLYAQLLRETEVAARTLGVQLQVVVCATLPSSTTYSQP